MEEANTLAGLAESEIYEAKQICLRADYDSASRSELWSTFHRWIAHSNFAQESNQLQATVLNELVFACSDPALEEEAWSFIRSLAAEWESAQAWNLKEMLRIACFEVVAEPPDYPPSLVRLFSLAANPLTRWAVFAAYEHFPWRLRPHAAKYSGGLVTDTDCDQWLVSQDLGDDEFLMQHTKSEQSAPPGSLGGL